MLPVVSVQLEASVWVHYRRCGRGFFLRDVSVDCVASITVPPSRYGLGLVNGACLLVLTARTLYVPLCNTHMYLYAVHVGTCT